MNHEVFMSRDEGLIRKNKALRYLGKSKKDKQRFIFSKLGNEITIITTKLCNLNCPYCYDKANINDKDFLSKFKEELTSNQVTHLIKTLKKIGVNNIRLTGGEALLKQGIFNILEECQGMFVTLCTNGLILKENLNKIIQIHPKDLHIHLSLDGIESHKKFRMGSDPYQIVELAKKIKKEHPEIYVSINTVLNKENIYELLQIYNLLKDAKIDRWTVSFPRLVKNALEKNFQLPKIKNLVSEFKKLIIEYYKDKKPVKFTFSYFYKFELLDRKLYHKPRINSMEHPCLPDASGAKGIIIDSFGNILDCLVLKPVLGNPINIKKVLEKDNLGVKELMSFLFKSLKSPFYDLKLRERKECLNCRYLKLCKGGCPANSYYLKGSLKETDITSCLMFYYFEKEILPELQDKRDYEDLIDKTKSIKILEERIAKNKELLSKIGLFA